MVLYDLRNFKVPECLQKYFGEFDSLSYFLATLHSGWVSCCGCGGSCSASEVQPQVCRHQHQGELLQQFGGFGCWAFIVVFEWPQCPSLRQGVSPHSVNPGTDHLVHLFLLFIWSLCFLTGCLSSSWKQADVFPVSHAPSSPSPSSLPRNPCI